jgi:hypothetical protein
MTQGSDGADLPSRAIEPGPGTAARPLLEAEDGPAPHLVQFYEREELLTERVATFLAEGLRQGDLVTVIATAARGSAYRHHLESDGIDVAAACAAGQLAFLDADDTLAQFMCNGEPDPRLFDATVGSIIEANARIAAGRKLRAYGEMVDVLWQQGHKAAALRRPLRAEWRPFR